MKILSKTISFTLAAVIVLTTVYVYICPLTATMGKTAVQTVAHACDSTVPASILSAAGAIDCFGTHMIIAAQVVEKLATATTIAFLVAFAAIAFYAFYKLNIRAYLCSLLFAFKNSFRKYRSRIRFLSEEKIRHYLILLGNYTIVSLA